MEHKHIKEKNPMMDFMVARYGLRNLILENQRRKIDALASPTGKADPPFIQSPKVMSSVITSQNHQLATGGLQTIKEEGEVSQKSINCPHCGQNINWCECPMSI